MRRVVAVAFIALVAFVACGVRAEDEEKDYYAELGLNHEASAAQIKRSFRKLSLKYHPDKGSGNEERYNRITEAYDVLSDPEKRQVYDIHGVEGLKRLKQPQQHDPFGGLFGHHGGGGIRKGPNFQMQMDVGLEDLYLGNQKDISIQRKVVCRKCRGTGAKGGATKVCKACGGSGTVMTVQQLGPGFNIQMQKPCDKCGGKGKVFKKKCEVCGGRRVVNERKTLQAVIERGMPDGHELKFERMSEQTPDTIPGDVIVKLRTRKHPRFTRRGNDLLHEMTITLREALLGFEKTVQHLDGRSVAVKRKKVTRPGQVITLKDEGMPVHNYPSQKGKMEVTITVAFPKKLTAEQKKLIAEALQ